MGGPFSGLDVNVPVGAVPATTAAAVPPLEVKPGSQHHLAIFHIKIKPFRQRGRLPVPGGRVLPAPRLVIRYKTLYAAEGFLLQAVRAKTAPSFFLCRKRWKSRAPALLDALFLAVEPMGTRRAYFFHAISLFFHQRIKSTSPLNTSTSPSMNSISAK